MYCLAYVANCTIECNDATTLLKAYLLHLVICYSSNDTKKLTRLLIIQRKLSENVTEI